MKWIHRFINWIKGGSKKPSTPSKPIQTEDSILKNLRQLWDSTEINTGYWQRAQDIVVKIITDHDHKYEDAEKLLFQKHGIVVPWPVIACIHSLEGSLRWDNNLHNGQSWDRKTTIVPKGRGPFSSWEEAAMDALFLKKRIIPKEWTIEATLDFLERYNGLGYRKYHKDVNTPYLWSGTNQYSKGKYVRDGEYDPSAVSKQVGAVLILKGLYYNGRSSQRNII